MGVAQRMKNALHGKVRLPVIVHDDADDIRQQSAALGRGAIEGQQNRRRHMQPLGGAANAIARFVHVFDGRLLDLPGDGLGHRRQLFRLASFHCGDGGRRNPDPEKVLQQFGQPVLGNKMTGPQIDGQRCNPGAILHRCRHALWKIGLAMRTAIRAGAQMRAMLRHCKRLRFGQVHDLPFAERYARRQYRRSAALRATHGIMVNHRIGRLDLPQRLAFVASLSAGLLARFLPQASHAGLFFQAVARRWFAAVGAVQAKLTLKLSHACR